MNDRFIDFYMNIAELTATKLSRAKRLQVGCVAVKENRIIAYGYNGTPHGWDNNCEIETDNGLKTKPEVLHAEMNCLMKIAKSTESSEDTILFITHSPCIECSKAIYQSGIKQVYYKTQYRSCDGIDFLKKTNVNVIQYGA